MMGNGSAKSLPPAERQATERSLTYVIITPAWNEAEFIQLLLESMVRQTVPPLKWVIISDGSTDGTDDIVKRYTAQFAWIELLRLPERSERHFAGKVHAFNAGYATVKGLDYDIIGNVDADISFEPDLFEFLLAKYAEQPLLGVAGAPYIENSSAAYNYSIVNIEDVTGHCQLFRRECFEDIGGYVPIKAGGIDSVAVLTARMKGWRTRTFTDKICIHHRKVGAAQSTRYAAAFRAGKRDYFGGTHPLWVFFRSLYHMKNKPYILGGVLLLAGYLSRALLRAERPIPAELVAFRRNEQMQRLKVICKKFFSFKEAAMNPNLPPIDSIGSKKVDVPDVN
jgi:biofilm PGA synthesis N-glycosyltransferase PgaC